MLPGKSRKIQVRMRCRLNGDKTGFECFYARAQSAYAMRDAAAAL